MLQTTTETDLMTRHVAECAPMRRLVEMMMTEGFHAEADQLAQLFADADLDAVLTVGVRELEPNVQGAVQEIFQTVFGTERLAQATTAKASSRKSSARRPREILFSPRRAAA